MLALENTSHRNTGALQPHLEVSARHLAQFAHAGVLRLVGSARPAHCGLGGRLVDVLKARIVGSLPSLQDGGNFGPRTLDPQWVWIAPQFQGKGPEAPLGRLP